MTHSSFVPSEATPITLRPYQQEAVDAVYKHLRQREDNPCVVLPTGTGKSVVLGQIATDAVTRWDGRVLVLAHVKELLEQNAEKIQVLCGDLDVGIYSAGLNRRDTDHSVIVAGIQSVYRRAEELGAFDLIIVDEAHLIAPDGEGMYRQFLQEAMTLNPQLRVIGLTATPYRLKGGEICQPDNILNHVCYEAGIKQMIVQGYLCKLKSRGGRVKADLDNLHVRGGEFIASEIEAAMDTQSLVASACREIVELTRDRNSVLIFTAGVDHCQHVASEISRRSGLECGIVTGDTPDGERTELLARFKGESVKADLFGNCKPRLKYLANVNVLTTGFDATNIDCVVLLRPTASVGLYVQMCLDMNTEILTPTGWARCHEIDVGDTVGAFDKSTSEIVWTDVKEKIHRPLCNSESMYGVQSPHLDIRVTDQHTMVFRGRQKTCVNWKESSACDLATRKDSYTIPIAGINDAVGIPLSDDEIRFIGWVLTDGHRNPHNNSVCISQSAQSEYNKDIVKMLDGCGFGYRTYHVPRTGRFACYCDDVRYVIPYGKPRKENSNLEGWGRLAFYLNNPINITLENISQRQLGILLEAMNLADGWKPKNLSWTPRTYRIAIGTYDHLADALQSLLIRRGYRCNITTQCQKGPWHSGKPKELKILLIRKQTRATVGGANNTPSHLVKNRCRLKPVPFSPNEMVWCVKTDYGTIVTRRNGKVAVLGNCGRGTRLHPDKEDCLVLDYGGNVLRHGPVDTVSVENKTSGSGETPAKECPQCNALIHASYRNCPQCGHEFPPPQSDLVETAGTEGILSGEITDTDYEVLDAAFHVHTKRGVDQSAPKTLRIDYQVGLNQWVSQWVCPEHSGWARRKFEQWWRERSMCPPPNNAHEAVILAEEGALATTQSITVRSVVGETFDKIIHCQLSDKPDYHPEPGWYDDGEVADDWASAAAQHDWLNDEDIPF